MIFKRKKGGPNPDEPKTKSGIFETVKDPSAPTGISSTPATSDEPPTRDAIFKSEPTISKKEPSTGWVAVIAGPKRGLIIPLGYGETKLGGLMEDGKSPVISYDSAQMEFQLRQGGQEISLHDREKVHIGDNIALFIPLCADGFDWRRS